VKINWNDFSFFPREDSWFIKEPKLVDDLIWFGLNYPINTGAGLFEGYTDQKPYEDYTGDLPRLDQESCSLSEFDIVFNGIVVNNMYIDDIKKLYRKTILVERITKLSK
jgi:hypothetical protein